MIEKSYMACKIAVPQVKQKILLRRGIGEIINNASLDEIVYLVAPFGSGKTMAILGWLKEHEKKAVWVTLDEGENSPLSFWAHLSAAILLFNGEHEKAENILDDTNFLENPRRFLREILIRVAPTIDERILIIDRFQYIRNGGLLREVKELFSNMLGCWRIIITARTELPSLFNDFLLKKHLCLVTLNNLNFNSDEINEYFNMNSLAISKKELSRIYDDTDGWPIALNAILMATHNEAVKFNDTAKAYIMNYFDSEIWDHLCKPFKEFMLKTSILDKLTPSLCHFVAEIADAAHILRNLYVNGFFLSKLEERDTYCYHRVFREFILDKLNASDIDARILYINAGWWLYEKNESILALICFYRAKFLQGINMAFKKVKPAYVGMDEYVKMTLCLTSLEIMDLKMYPEIAVRIALLHFLTNNIVEMQRIYKIVKEWLEPGVLSIPPEEYTDFFWEVGWLLYVNPDEDILFNDKFDKWVNVKEYAPHLLESDRARSSTLRLPSILRGARDFSINIERTLEFYEMNNAAHNSIRDDAGLLISDIIYAEICYEREDFGKAGKIIKCIMPSIERERYTELYFSCIVLLVKITRAVHNTEEITGLIECLKTQIENNGHFFLLPNFHAFEVQNRIVSGIPGTTKIFERENKPYRDKFYYYLIYRHITWVRILISEKKFNEATLFLGNLDYLLHQYKRNMDLIEVNILRSIAEYGLGHKADARQYLKLALDDGQKCGFIRIFSDDAMFLWPVLSLIYKRDSNEYIEKIKASCSLTLERTKALISFDKTVYESLTDKEITILKLLQVGKKYWEIALSENISRGTVKWYVNKIYSKLQVHSRTEAIFVALKLKII